MLTHLTPSHLDLFLDLKENNPGQWEMGKEYDNVIDNKSFFIHRLCAERAYSLGWIENNKLLSISTLYEFAGTASWTWLYYCNIKTNYTNFSNTHGLELINEMFSEAAKRKLTMCFTLVREGFPSITSDATGRMRNKIASWHDQVPEIKKYHWVDEAKIPAGVESKYSYIQWMMGHRAWPVDLRLRLGVLKQEHRQEILFS